MQFNLIAFIFNPLVLLFATMALGNLFGERKFRKFKFGISGTLFIWLGMQPATVLIALSIYAMFPILKNTYAGLVSVDPQYIEAARGCGMTPSQRLYKIEIPLALPTIIGGLRMSTIYTVSWTVLAAMIGQGGLGTFIYTGISANDNGLILMGAIPAALLAFILGSLIAALQRKVVPKGMRKEADEL